MLTNLKIGSRLTIGFAVVICVFLAAMSVVLYFQKETLQAAQQIQRESLPFTLVADLKTDAQVYRLRRPLEVSLFRSDLSPTDH